MKVKRNPKTYLLFVCLRMMSLTKSIKSLFLLDAIGATVSTVFLGFVLVIFNEYIGIPISTLYLLAGIAAAFMLYSWSCYFMPRWQTSRSIKVIGAFNLSYSFLTLGLVIFHFNELTLLGISYFVGEMIILWILVFIEWRASQMNP